MRRLPNVYINVFDRGFSDAIPPFVPHPPADDDEAIWFMVL